MIADVIVYFAIAAIHLLIVVFNVGVGVVSCQGIGTMGARVTPP
jgi:hypothetical protein